MDHTERSVPRVQFEVQKIIGISVGVGNVRTYQVEWAPAWVSGYHLIGCEHLIDEFLQKQQHKDSVESEVTVEFQIDQCGTIDSQVNDEHLVASSFPVKTEDELVTNPIHVEYSMACDKHLEMDLPTPTPRAISSDERSAESPMVYVPIKIEDPPDALCENSSLLSSQSNCDQEIDSLVSSKPYCESVQESEHASLTAEVRCTQMNIDELDLDSKGEKTDDSKSNKGVDKYVCDQCGKTFKYRCLLLRHIPVHIGQLRYQCNFCDKSYARKDSLMKHIPNHT